MIGVLLALTATTYAQSLVHDASGGLRIDGVLISSGGSTQPGVLKSPWAPASDLVTLADRARQRPRGVADDALACWVTDQAIRDGQPVTVDGIHRQRAAFHQNGTFFIRDDDSGLWIANSRVGLRFDTTEDRRDLVSFYAMAPRIEMIGQRAQDASPFRVQVVRYREDGTTGIQNLGPQWRNASEDPGVVVEVGGQQADTASHHVSVEEDELKLTLTWAGVHVPDSPGSLDVQMELRLHADNPMTRWRSRIAGDLPRAGVSKVRSPVLPGLGYPGEVDVCYAWGSQHGVLKRGDASRTYGTYPSSQWAIQHCSVSFGPRTVLYVATHDPDSHVKSFLVQPGAELYCSADVPDTGVRGNATYEQPYDVVIAPLEGDWFDAAQAYRRWALANAPWAAKPLRERDDVCHRMLKVAYWARINWPHGDARDGDTRWAFDHAMLRIPPDMTLDWYLEALQLPPERLGAIHYGWQDPLWDTQFPYWESKGPHIEQELRRQTQMGVSAYIYTNPCWFASTHPAFDETVRAQITRNIDGSLYYEDYNERMYEISRVTDLFRDVVVNLARQARTLGANGVYYDQYSGVLRGGDYDTQKALTSLGRGGNVLTRAKQRTMRYVREQMGSDFGFTSEFYVETGQHLWDVSAVTIHHDTVEVPLVPAIYSGYVALHGSGLDHRTRPTAATVVLGRNFLWGTAPGWTQFATDIRRYYSRNLLRQITHLRSQLDDFVVYGTMLRPPEVLDETPMIPLDDWYVMGSQRQTASVVAHEATLWAAHDGRRALLLANYDEQPREVRFALPALGLAGADAVTLLEPTDGTSVSSTGEALAVRLPGRSVAAAILPAVAGTDAP